MRADFLQIELDYLTRYAVVNGADCPDARAVLRALWTAYCFHAGYLVDTAPYDNDLLRLWNRMGPAQKGFEDYEDFDNWMCDLLI